LLDPTISKSKPPPMAVAGQAKQAKSYIASFAPFRRHPGLVPGSTHPRWLDKRLKGPPLPPGGPRHKAGVTEEEGKATTSPFAKPPKWRIATTAEISRRAALDSACAAAYVALLPNTRYPAAL
jgi:hypothetical protein